MRILIIEDDPKAAGFVRKGLAESGYATEWASSGNEGVRLGLDQDWDAVICDVMLPDRDGWSVVTDLRSHGVETPIIMLTARDSVSDKVKGLDLGADDYVVKPFAFTELLARLRSVTRRGSATRPDAIRLADLLVDPVGMRASRAGRDLGLTSREFNLLWLLARRQGEVLSRRVIAEHVWDVRFDGTSNVVDVAVRRLRQKLDDPFETKLLQTVRGLGYVLRDDQGHPDV